MDNHFYESDVQIATILDLRSVKNILADEYAIPTIIDISQASAIEICERIGSDTLLVSDACPTSPGASPEEARFFAVTTAYQTHFKDVYPLDMTRALLSTVRTLRSPKMPIKMLSVPAFEKTKERAYAIASISFYEGLDAIAIHRSWRPYFDPPGTLHAFKKMYVY